MAFICGDAHESGMPDDLPDAGEGTCCFGSAVNGPDYCTCWTPVYEIEQQDPDPTLETTARARSCDDCAFLPTSPERQGDPAYANSGEFDVDRLRTQDAPFYCHQGMRRPIAWRHPAGVEIPAELGGYDPVYADGRPFQCDGTPALICAGWAAAKAVRRAEYADQLQHDLIMEAHDAGD